MKMDNAFLSNIVRPGIMFKVIKPTKDSVFGIGTTGFIGYVKGQDQDFPNVIFYKIIITRRGKSGKTRLEPGEISVPIFLPKCKNLETILPKVDRKYFVFIDTNQDLMPRNVFELDNHSFLGWASAWGCFLSKLHTRVKKIKVWPSDSTHILNIIRRLPNRFIDDPTNTLKNCTSQDFRTTTAMEIRFFESTLSRCAVEYLYRTTHIEHSAVVNLLNNTENLKLDAEQLKKIKTSIANKLDTLETIIELRDQKEMLM